MPTTALKPIAIAASVIFLLGILVSGGTGQSTRAATPSLDEILGKLATYEVGQVETILWQLRDYVRARKDSADTRLAVEERLDAFLGTKATSAGKMAVCRELRLIGSEKSVPVLERLLLDKDSTDMARYALESIPGIEPDKALLRALPGTKGEARLGIVSALGRRKAKSAVPEMARLLTGLDPGLARTAAGALGEIGTAEAADVLEKALPAAKSEVKDMIASSLMKTAEAFSAAGDRAAAARIYEKLTGEKLSPPLNLAVRRGRIASAGDGAASLIREALAGPDPVAHEAAIDGIKGAFSPSSITEVATFLPRLPAASQVKLLAVLATYPKENVLAVVLQATRSEARDVRIAALNALEKIGDATTVLKLAQTAAATVTAEQAAARNALWGLKGRDVDEAVLAALAVSREESAQAELVRALGERRIYAGKSLAFELAGSGAAMIQTQAVRAIRAIGTPSDVSGMLDLLLTPGNDALRRDIENTIVGLTQKISSPAGRAATVKARLATEKDPQNKAVLFRVLGRIGDDTSLTDLRRGLQNKNPDLVDAAARALFAWPSATAKDDVLAIAESSANSTHKILALQAFVRMTGLEKFRAPAAAVKDLDKALSLATRPEEKKLILAALPDFSCPDALKVTSSLLRDKDVAAEAQVAVNKIKTQLEQAAKLEAK